MSGKTSTIHPRDIVRIRERSGRWKYPELFVPLRQGIARQYEDTNPKEIRRRRDAVLRWAKRQGLVISIHTWREHKQPDPTYPEVLVYGIAFVPHQAAEEADRVEAETAAAQAAGLPTPPDRPTPQAGPPDDWSADDLPEIPEPEPQNPHRGHTLKRAMDASRLEWEKKMRPRDPNMPAMD